MEITSTDKTVETKKTALRLKVVMVTATVLEEFVNSSLDRAKLCETSKVFEMGLGKAEQRTAGLQQKTCINSFLHTVQATSHADGLMHLFQI